MEVKIQGWGNSAGLRLNQAVLKQIGLGIGESLSLEIKGRVLILKPAEPAVTIESLLAGCTEENMRISDEDSHWLDSAPAGREFK